MSGAAKTERDGRDQKLMGIYSVDTKTEKGISIFFFFEGEKFFFFGGTWEGN